MEFRDLKRQYCTLKAEIDTAIDAVLSRADFISGQAVHILEENLANFVGVKNCICCANGTDALVLALHAWGIGAGDAVFVPNFTFFSTAECAGNLGAVPIFVDIDENTFNISPAALEAAIQAVVQKGELRPRVVIAVDLFGLPANYPELNAICEKYNLLLLEDGAQGFGGHLQDKKVCSFGDAATTSFFPAKPLGCYGDGGAVFTNDDHLATLIRSLAVHGKGTDKYDNLRIGYNSRLDTIQAEILNVKLNVFPEELVRINQIAATYTENLKNFVVTPLIPENYYSSWAQYTIRLESPEQRTSVMDALKKQQIPTTVYYPRVLSEMKAFQDMQRWQVDATPIAKKMTQTALSLPIHPYLEDHEQSEVIDAICCLTNF